MLLGITESASVGVQGHGVKAPFWEGSRRERSRKLKLKKARGKRMRRKEEEVKGR